MTFSFKRASLGWTLGMTILLSFACSEGGAQERFADPISTARVIRLTDLEGAKVDAKFVSEQLVEREGRKGPVTVEEDWNITIERGGKIAWHFRPTTHTRSGARTGRGGSFKASVDKASDAGTGRAMWQFSDGKLTFVRSYEAGAFRTVIAFAYDGQDLSCTANKSIFYEQGKAKIRVDSVTDGVPITILNWKLVSSDCRVTLARGRAE